MSVFPAAKRLLDVLFSLLVLVAASPVLMLASLAVRLDSPGPVLFRQWRAGREGRPFRILKFRTLVAGEKGAPYAPLTGPDDPRLTRVGRFLRRYSMDELPQFLNVLAGHMSIVGPRPHALEEDAELAERIPDYRERRAVRPGITGLAQVSGCRGVVRSDEDMIRRLKHDLRYIRNRSLLLDMSIMVRTVPLFFSDRLARECGMESE